MLNISYVSLHNHTTFSIGDSLLKPIELFEQAKKFGQKAVAVTDHGTLAGLWDSLKASKKTGVKLIPGCEIFFMHGEKTPLYHLVLLAKNLTGYKNLLKINKLGYDNYTIAFGDAISRVTWEMLQENSEGLICITACGNSPIGQAIMNNDIPLAKEHTQRLKNIFGYDNFALELQPHNLQRRSIAASGPINQQKINRALKAIADDLKVRCVVATDAHYLNPEDWEVHDFILANSSKQPIYSGNRLKYDKNDFYVKHSLDVAKYFVRHHKYWTPEFIQSLFENTIFFADQCEFPNYIDPFISTGNKYQLPVFPYKEEDDYNDFVEWKKTYNCGSLADDALFYRYRCYKGLEEKIKQGKIPEEDREWCEKQIIHEAETLEFRNFSSYMLISSHFIKWCNDNDILVNYGRGSCAGSLTAFLTDIHKIYPKKYGLIFERFLNKYKEAMPDIDHDIESSKRHLLHDFIKQKYGYDNFAHVLNIINIKPKPYARDVSRVFELGGEGRKYAVELGNRIAESIPAELGEQKITTCLEKAPLFAEFAKVYPEIAKYAVVGGNPRDFGTHAGGIVISDKPLYEIVSVKKDKHGTSVVELDKERVEELGLVKIDTLGLKTLGIVSKTKEIVKSLGKNIYKEFDFTKSDEKTFDMISNGETNCVFQLADTAAHVCKLIKPKNLEDLAIISALVRPAAKDIIEDFVKVRNGDKPMELLHPALENSFKDTYGFGLFEESLLKVANDIAGWDLADADSLRKLTKLKGKYPEKAEKWRNDFIKGAINNKGFSKEDAEKIWDECISKYGGYAFNKSHSVAYSCLSYETAYLKANYTLEFLVANLISEVKSNNPKTKANILKIKKEMKDNNINIIPPNINKSITSFKIIDEKTLMTGFDALKYMGGDTIPELLEKRPFTSFKDMMYRLDSSKARSPSIQALAGCGALDEFEDATRQQMFQYASDYRNKLRVHMKKLQSKYDRELKKALKNNTEPPTPPTEEDKLKHLEEFNYSFPKEKKWNIRERFAIEEYYLGEGISGSIFERYDAFLRTKVTKFTDMPILMPFRDLEDVDEKTLRKANTHNIYKYGLKGLKGVLTSVWSFIVKKENSAIFGQEMARLTVQDPYGNILDIIAFPDAWQNFNDRIKKLSNGKTVIEPGIAIYFTGMFQWENSHTYSFILSDILSFKDKPKTPPDFKKSKKTKSLRSKNVTIEDVLELNEEDLADKLEDESLESGDYFDDEDPYDPFN